MPQGVIYSVFDLNVNSLPAIRGKRYEIYFVADGGQSDATSCSCNMVVRFEGKFRLLRRTIIIAALIPDRPRLCLFILRKSINS